MPLQPRRVHPPSAPALDRRGGRLQTPSRRRRVIGNYEAARTAVREIADATGMTPPELFLGERALGGGTVLPLENVYNSKPIYWLFVVIAWLGDRSSWQRLRNALGSRRHPTRQASSTGT